MFIKKYLKWISTALVLTGIFLTNLNIYPINIYFHGLGVVGWTVAGFLSGQIGHTSLFALLHTVIT